MNADRIVGFIGGIGSVILLTVMVRDMTVAERPSVECRPIYVRSIDQHSPTELRRIANWRERLERVK